MVRGGGAGRLHRAVTDQHLETDAPGREFVGDCAHCLCSRARQHRFRGPCGRNRRSCDPGLAGMADVLWGMRRATRRIDKASGKSAAVDTVGTTDGASATLASGHLHPARLRFLYG